MRRSMKEKLIRFFELAVSTAVIYAGMCGYGPQIDIIRLAAAHLFARICCGMLNRWIEK